MHTMQQRISLERNLFCEKTILSSVTKVCNCVFRAIPF